MALIDYISGSDVGFTTSTPQAAGPSGASDPGSVHDSMALRDHVHTREAEGRQMAEHFVYQSLRPPFAPLPVPGKQLSAAVRAHYSLPAIATRAPPGDVATHQGPGHAFSAERFSGHPPYFSTRSKELLTQTAAVRRGLQGLEARRKTLNKALGRDPSRPEPNLPGGYTANDRVPCS